MPTINRRVNTETMTIEVVAGKNSGGVVYDNKATTLVFTYSDPEFVADKDVAIIFDTLDDMGVPQNYDVIDGTFQIPWAVMSRVSNNKLRYQLVFIGRELESPSVYNTRADILQVSASLADISNIGDPVVEDIASSMWAKNHAVLFPPSFETVSGKKVLRFRTAAGDESESIIDIDLDGGFATDQELSDGLATKADKTTTVNGHALSGDVTVTKADVGLGNVDNTSDADKPISTATQAALNGVNAKIPEEATAQNKLADKAYVNQAVSTNTANFLGTYKALAEDDNPRSLGFTQAQVDEMKNPMAAATAAISTKLAEKISNPSNNDYAFVEMDFTDPETSPDESRRYKFDGSSWVYEYTLNTSSFTDPQWAAINSGLSSADKTTIDGLSSTYVAKNNVTVPSTVPTLAWGQTSSLGSVDGKSFQVTMPANPDTDTKVSQSLLTDNYNLPLLLSQYQTNDSTVNRTGGAYRNNSIYANPSTGSVYAQTFFANNKEVAVDENVVHITDAETITGAKTFTSRATFDYWNPALRLNTGHSIGFNINMGVDEYNVAPAVDKQYIHSIFDKNNVVEGKFQFFHGSSGSRVWRVNALNNAGTEKSADLLHIDNDGTAYMMGLSRTYNASNINDIVTIGSLQASTDVVHTSGNETIAGTKTFTSPVIMSGGHDSSFYVVRNGRFSGSGYVANQSEGLVLLTSTDATPKSVLALGVRQWASPFGRVLNVTIYNNDGTSYKQHNLIDYDGYVRSTTPPASQNDIVVANTEWVNTKLGNYVTLDTVQTITASKTFDDTPMFRASSGYYNIQLRSKTVKIGDTINAWTRINQIQMSDMDGTATGFLQNVMRPISIGGTYVKVHEIAIGSPNASGTSSQIWIRKTASGDDAWVESSYRTYNASNTSDVVTIGSLQASTDVVHTSGNETVAGSKTFTSAPHINSGSDGVLYLDDTRGTTAGTKLVFRKSDRWQSTMESYSYSDHGETKLLVSDLTSANWWGLTLRNYGSGADNRYALLEAYRSYASASNNDILCKGHVADMMSANVSNQQISLTSSRGVSVDSFTLNQMSGKNIVLPAGSTQYQNQSVTFSAQSPADFSDYPYMASVSVTGLTADMYATVTFSDAQVSSGQYAPFCQTVAGAVRLYAKSDVGTQTIPTISIGMDDSSAQQSMSNFVTLTGGQTVGGAKTFTSGLVLTAYQAETINMTGGPRIGTNTSATQNIMRLFKNSSDTEYVARDIVYQGANTKNTARLWYLQRQNSAGTGVDTASLMMAFSSDGAYLQTPYRTYNSSNTTDVVTIGSLQASTDVVHRSGMETITGRKTFEAINGKQSFHSRITATSKIEWFRCVVGDSSTNFNFLIIAQARGVGAIGRLTVAYDGLNGLGFGFSGVCHYGTPGDGSCFYAYLETVNSVKYLVVCFGNGSSNNNYYAMTLQGAMSGAGIEQSLDFSYTGTYRTETIASNTTTKYINIGATE